MRDEGTEDLAEGRRETIDQVAGLMDEFRLTELRLQQGDMVVAFRRRSTASKPAALAVPEADAVFDYDLPVVGSPVASAPKGIPITSPMNGIYYGSASPGAPAYVREGDSVSLGQVIGLIEAMKVFNEIPSPFSGTVVQIVAQSGQVVNPGEVLLYIS